MYRFALMLLAAPNLIIKSWSNVLLFTGYGEDLVGRVSESIELECPHSAGRQIVYFLTGNTLRNKKNDIKWQLILCERVGWKTIQNIINIFCHFLSFQSWIDVETMFHLAYYSHIEAKETLLVNKIRLGYLTFFFLVDRKFFISFMKIPNEGNIVKKYIKPGSWILSALRSSWFISIEGGSKLSKLFISLNKLAFTIDLLAKCFKIYLKFSFYSLILIKIFNLSDTE